MFAQSMTNPSRIQKSKAAEQSLMYQPIHPLKVGGSPCVGRCGWEARDCIDRVERADNSPRKARRERQVSFGKGRRSPKPDAFACRILGWRSASYYWSNNNERAQCCSSGSGLVLALISALKRGAPGESFSSLTDVPQGTGRKAFSPSNIWVWQISSLFLPPITIRTNKKRPRLQKSMCGIRADAMRQIKTPTNRVFRVRTGRCRKPARIRLRIWPWRR